MKLLELKEICANKGFPLTDRMVEQFDLYAKLLQEWNQKINLTAIDEYEDIIEKHFYDSLLIMFQHKLSGRLADVGSGAGFPSLPLKIVDPTLEIVIIETLQKRCNFLNEVVKQLGLENVTIINARAEDYAKDHRESFDIVTARAVANLSMLSELCIPLVKMDGVFIALKAMDAYNEEQKASKALKILGVERINAYEDHLSDGSLRVNLVYKKVSATPKKYPRMFAKIKKQPL